MGVLTPFHAKIILGNKTIYVHYPFSLNTEIAYWSLEAFLVENKDLFIPYKVYITAVGGMGMQGAKASPMVLTLLYKH